MFHWVLNNNMCALTLMEKAIRCHITNGNFADFEKQPSFIGRIVEPVYDFSKDNNDLSFEIYSVTIIMWLISVSKLYNKYKMGEITSVFDLMRC